MTHDEIVTQRLIGNGLIFERTTRPGGKVPWWWISAPYGVVKDYA